MTRRHAFRPEGQETLLQRREEVHHTRRVTAGPRHELSSLRGDRGRESGTTLHIGERDLGAPPMDEAQEDHVRNRSSLGIHDGDPDGSLLQ